MMRLPAVILIVVLTGCNGVVDVVDPAGKPVAGAAVAPVTLSMNGAAVMTNAKGEALVPTSIGPQPDQWISISKAGYTTMQTPMPAAWPLRVILAPIAIAGRPATRR